MIAYTYSSRVWLMLVVVVAFRFSDPARAGDAVSVTVRTVESGEVSGLLQTFSLKDGLRLKDREQGRTRVFPADQVVSITTDVSSEPGVSMSEVPHSIVAALGGAEARLGGRVKAFTNDNVIMATQFLGSVSIPLDSVRIWRNHQFESSTWESAIAFLEDSDAQEDRLFLANGDVLSAFVLRLDEHGFEIESQSGPIRLPHERVAAARILNGPGDDGIDQKALGMHAVIETVDGSRVRTTSLMWAADRIVLKLSNGVDVIIKPDKIRRIDIHGGRLTWLTELEPVTVQQTPMIFIDWPYQIDRNVLGNSISIAGRSHAQGIGVHSGSILTFDLGGRFSKFIASYGVDDESCEFADLELRIRIDGRDAHCDESVRRGALLGPIEIDVSGAKRLELISGFGRHGGVCDRLDWIDPALIR